MQINIRSNGKCVQVNLKHKNIDFDSGLLTTKEAESFVEIFIKAAEDLKTEIRRVNTYYVPGIVRG
jgi:hypothetical protein